MKLLVGGQPPRGQVANEKSRRIEHEETSGVGVSTRKPVLAQMKETNHLDGPRTHTMKVLLNETSVSIVSRK
jgi:hypothetical protein